MIHFVRFRALFLSLFIGFSLFTADALRAQQRIYVNGSAAGAKNGTSWQDAFPDLQAALGAATPGTQIWMAKGTYKPTAGKKRTVSFVMKAGVSVFGGFAGTESSAAERVAGNATILSGNIGKTNDSTDNSYHVVVINSFSGDTIALDGLTIAYGAASKDSVTARQGAGMLMTDNNKVKLNNCIIEHNYSFNGGGGVYLVNSSPVFVNCLVRANGKTARTFANGGNYCEVFPTGGGGVYNVGGFPVFKDCTFGRNFGIDLCFGSAGLGFSGNTGGGTFMNCRFANQNRQYDNGPGTIVGASNSALSFTDCVFEDNYAQGIGVFAGSLLVERCIFRRGKAGAIWASDARVTIHHSEFRALDQFAVRIGAATAGTSVVASTFIDNVPLGYGALSVYQSDMLIDSCRFENNHRSQAGSSYGGALENFSSSLTVQNSIFMKNSAASGGAICNRGTGDVPLFEPVIRACVFEKNQASEGTVNLSGADIHNDIHAHPRIENCRFLGSIGGTAVTNYMGASTIVGCTISGYPTAGIFNYDAYTTPTIINCTLSNNGESNVYNYNGTFVVKNTIFHGMGMKIRQGTANATYCVFPTAVAGSGNIVATDVLVDPDGADNINGTTDDDLRPKAGSAPIDAGTVQSLGITLPLKDIAGNWRIANGKIDIGAYEYPIPLQPQTITFAKPADMAYGDEPVTLVPSASSGLTVALAVTGPAHLDGQQLIVTGVGTVTLTATQPGDDIFAEAPTVIHTVKVARASQEITFAPIGDRVLGEGEGTIALVATASTTLPVAFEVLSGPATVEHDVLTLTGTGTVTVEASQAGDDLFLPAAVQQRFVVSTVTGALPGAEYTLRLYPNPANTWVAVSGLPRQATVSMLDLVGRERAVAQNAEDNIDLSSLAPGQYILVIRTADEQVYRRFTKK